MKAAAAAVADRTDELRARMDGWGEARVGPHLAEELAALEERIRRIEQYVADDLAAALSELVSEHVVEALDERERERPKGLFKLGRKPPGSGNSDLRAIEEVGR